MNAPLRMGASGEFEGLDTKLSPSTLTTRSEDWPMGPNTKMIRLLALGATLTLGLALGACGDDDDPQGAGDDAAEDTAGAVGGDAVQILDFQFEPTNLTVEVGSTVTFTNEDDFAHTAEADDGSFDTGNLDGGAAGDITFDEAGEYPYFCAIHNYMKGTITVE